MATQSETQNLILDHESILSKIDRMAYEIYESNYGTRKLVLVGIDKRGSYLAGLLETALAKISKIAITNLTATKQGNGVELVANTKEISGKPVVIVDDVLYSGTTVFHAIAKVMQYDPEKVQTAILIDRGHRSIPVRPDFVGLKLATSLKQHVTMVVNARSKKAQAFLE